MLQYYTPQRNPLQKGGRLSIDLMLFKSFSLSFSLFSLSFSLSFFLRWSSSSLEVSARPRKSFKVNGCDCLIASCCALRTEGSIDTEVWIQILRLDLVGLLSKCCTLYFFRNIINLLRLLSFFAGLCDLAMVISCVLGCAEIHWS